MGHSYFSGILGNACALLMMVFPAIGFSQDNPVRTPQKLSEYVESEEALGFRNSTQVVEFSSQAPHLAELTGTWVAVSQTVEGKETPKDKLLEEQLVIDGKTVQELVTSPRGRTRSSMTEDRLTVVKGIAKPEVFVGRIGHLPLPEADKRKGILESVNRLVPEDKIFLKTRKDPVFAQGIWKVEGAQLKICLAPLMRPVPDDFSAPEGSGLTLTVYERLRKDQ